MIFAGLLNKVGLTRERRAKLVFFPIAALGLAVLIVQARSRQGPQRQELTERATAVRVIVAPRVRVVPRVVGYGLVQSTTVWHAVAEVAGKVGEMHPKLKKGAMLPAGTVALRIDPEVYDRARVRSTAEFRSVEAQLAELEQVERSNQNKLQLELRSLALAESELNRTRKLHADGVVPLAKLEATERSAIAQRSKVEALRSALNVVPAQRQALEAQASAGQTRVQDRRREVDKATVVLPIDARITRVHVQREQHAPVGKVLFTAEGIGVAEIMAQVSPQMLARLAPSRRTTTTLRRIELADLRDAFGLSAKVRMRPGSRTIEWDARFSRLSEEIDPKTGTIGVYVEVVDSYAQARPGHRPPLLKNMYCEVELRGRPRPPSVVVPRRAVHVDVVYVSNSDNRLERRTVVVDFVEGEYASIASGVQAGESVVVSDLTPAIEGMLLAPQVDASVLDDLEADVTGEGQATEAPPSTPHRTPAETESEPRGTTDEATKR